MRYSGRYANRPCWRTASAPSSSELFIGPNHASEYIGERNHQSGLVLLAVDEEIPVRRGHARVDRLHRLVEHQREDRVRRHELVPAGSSTRPSCASSRTSQSWRSAGRTHEALAVLEPAHLLESREERLLSEAESFRTSRRTYLQKTSADTHARPSRRSRPPPSPAESWPWSWRSSTSVYRVLARVKRTRARSPCTCRGAVLRPVRRRPVDRAEVSRVGGRCRGAHAWTRSMTRAAARCTLRAARPRGRGRPRARRGSRTASAAATPSRASPTTPLDAVSSRCSVIDRQVGARDLAVLILDTHETVGRSPWATPGRDGAAVERRALARGDGASRPPNDGDRDGGWAL